MREYLKYTLLAVVLAIGAKLIIFYVDPTHEGLGKYFLLVAPSFTVAMLYPGMILTRNLEFGGFITGRLISAAGIRITVISGGLNAVFDYFYYSAINTTILPARLANEIAKVNSDPTLDKLTKEHAIGGATNFFSPFMQVNFPMFITMAAGIFFTLVLAYFLRKYPEGQRRPFFSHPTEPSEN